MLNTISIYPINNMPPLSLTLLLKIKETLISIEKLLAASSLLALLALSLSQVIMRNIFEIGFSDIDTIARHLVLFITFMGAALVSEGNQHIKIDCVTSVINDTKKQRLKVPLLLISAFICAIFFYYALQFWLDEKSYAQDNEQLALYLALILPFGFFTLSLHFLLLSLTQSPNEQPL